MNIMLSVFTDGKLLNEPSHRTPQAIKCILNTKIITKNKGKWEITMTKVSYYQAVSITLCFVIHPFPSSRKGFDDTIDIFALSDKFVRDSKSFNSIVDKATFLLV